jgi:hypothetical protein
MNRSVFQAIKVEYSGSPSITVSVDGSVLLNNITLPTHDTFRGRRITLPNTVNSSGYISHLESTSTQLQNEQFEAIPVESFSQQQLFHYYEIGFRGGSTLTPTIYLDSITPQTQSFNISTANTIDSIRIYFNALAYGYVPHIHSTSTSTNDAEILWAKPIALPPRFYRGIRTHAEFQITYKGDVDLEWFLDGVSIGTYTDFLSLNTKTEKAYFQSGTIGHVLQYIHTNPEAGGKVYMVETDITLADLEQQSMRPQAEEG